MFDFLGKLERVARRNVVRVKIGLAAGYCGEMP